MVFKGWHFHTSSIRLLHYALKYGQHTWGFSSFYTSKQSLAVPFFRIKNDSSYKFSPLPSFRFHKKNISPTFFPQEEHFANMQRCPFFSGSLSNQLLSRKGDHQLILKKMTLYSSGVMRLWNRGVRRHQTQQGVCSLL